MYPGSSGSGDGPSGSYANSDPFDKSTTGYFFHKKAPFSSFNWNVAKNTDKRLFNKIYVREKRMDYCDYLYVYEKHPQLAGQARGPIRPSPRPLPLPFPPHRISPRTKSEKETPVAGQ